MKLEFARYAHGISVAAAVLAGCGGAQPPIGAQDAGGAAASSMVELSPQVEGGLLYVSTTYAVYVYRKK
jgi:hypothetical protein